MENLTQNTEPTSAPVPPTTPKPRSEAQIAASRANGAKSKGPKTPEGKRIAAMNAERHGILSTWAVMDGEDQACFIQLAHNLSELFQPADEHEENLVEIMVTSTWRRARALAMETCGFSFFHRYQTRLAEQHNNPSNNPYDLAFAGLSASLASNKDADARALELLHRYEIRHTRAYNRAVKDLFEYRKLRGLQPIPTFDQSAAEQEALTTSQPESSTTQPNSTPNAAQTEPRAQASVPQLPTNAAPPPPIQHPALPNEPKPTPTTAAPQPQKPHANHPARNKFKKNRRRK